MFETQKIDSFFSTDKNLLDEKEKVFMGRRMAVVRFFKLFLPALVALLFGVGIILFDFDNAAEAPIGFADEENIYFEKFRMKNTVFEITNRDGKKNILKAKEVEELEAGAKIYNLTNPDAKSVEKGKVITVTALKGKYNHNSQVLDLKSQVVANYNKNMTIKTNSANYNFMTEYGYGNEKVVGEGNSGSFVADKFTFDKKKNIATLINNVTLINNKTKIQTPEKATIFLDENKFIATKATITKEADVLKGDMVTAFFNDTKKFEISKAYSKGHTEFISGGKQAFSDDGEYNTETRLIKLINNVKIVDKSGYVATAKQGFYDVSKKTFTLENDVLIVNGKNTIKAPKAIYFENKDELRFYGGISVRQENGVATAKNGVYYIKKNIAELEDSVVLTKNGNTVSGDKAISDFNTSQSRLVAKKGKRVSGKLYESTFKNKKRK